MQRAGLAIDDVEKIVVGRKQSIWDLKLFLMNWLQFKENEAQIISWWVIENQKEGAKTNINYDEDRELDKSDFVERMRTLLTNKGELGKYFIFNQSEIEPLKKKLWKELSPFLSSIEETIKLDDETNKGYVSLEGLKESFEIMEIKFDQKLEEFVYYFLFLKSQNVERIEYKPLIDLLNEIDESFEKQKSF